MKTTKNLAYSAMIMALIGAFLLVDRLFGSALLAFLQFLIPLPFAYYTVQHGNRNGLILLLATILMSVIVSTIIGIISVALYGLMGWLYGVFVNRGANRLQLLGLSFLVNLVIIIITMFALGSIMGYGTIAEQVAYLEELMVSTFATFGLEKALVDKFLKPIFYISTILTAFLEAYLVHTVYLILNMRLKKPLPETMKLSEVKWPKSSGYIALLGLLGIVVLPQIQLEPVVEEIGWFITILARGYLIFHGILFFYRIKNKPIYRKLGFYSIILVILLPNLLGLPMAILGFLALVSDLVDRLSQ